MSLFPRAAGILIEITDHQRHSLHATKQRQANVLQRFKHGITTGDADVTEDRQVTVFQVAGDDVDVTIVIDVTGVTS